MALPGSLPADTPLGDTSEPGSASIELKTSMLVPELHSEDFPLSDSIDTMQALILELGRRTKVKLINSKGDLIDFLDVRLNGKNINFFPDGLATRLQSGDQVLVRLIAIGGG
jgi:molybdopterin converting factor small subunit